MEDHKITVKYSQVLYLENAHRRRLKMVKEMRDMVETHNGTTNLIYEKVRAFFKKCRRFDCIAEIPADFDKKAKITLPRATYENLVKSEKALIKLNKRLANCVIWDSFIEEDNDVGANSVIASERLIEIYKDDFGIVVAPYQDITL